MSSKGGKSSSVLTGGETKKYRKKKKGSRNKSLTGLEKSILSGRSKNTSKSHSQSRTRSNKHIVKQTVSSAQK